MAEYGRWELDGSRDLGREALLRSTMDDELERLGLDAFTRTYDPDHDKRLNENWRIGCSG